MQLEDDSTPGIGADPVPLLATRSDVLFPGAVAPLVVPPDADVERVREAPFVVVACVRDVGGDPYRDASIRREHLHDIGCLARVLSDEQTGAGTTLIHGIARVRLDSLIQSPRGPEATITVVHDDAESDNAIVLAKTVRSLALSIIDRTPELPAAAQELVERIAAPGDLADLIAANLEMPFTDKTELLQTIGVAERLRRLVAGLARQLEIVELRARVFEKVSAQLAGQTIDGDVRKTILALQKSALLEELSAEETSAARKKGLFGSLRAAFGFAPRAGAVEDIDMIRARARREFIPLQIAAIDAELEGA